MCITKVVPIKYVYDHLICEFNHYDCCLTGLLEIDGEKWFCWFIEEDDYQVEPTYSISPVVDWTLECDEYLADYRKAYLHWFHDEQPRKQFGGWPLKWFSEKWRGRNPIEDQVERI